MTAAPARIVPREARAQAERIKSAWRDGESPDAASALALHPELASLRSIVIDLAYEEYLLRERHGVPPEPATFARAFPNFQASVQDLIEAHCLLVARPELLASPDINWPEVGETLEGLELRRELGRGSFGRAYLAFDSAIDRYRVIKLTPGGAAEGRLIGGLFHPHVIDVLWTRPVGCRTAVCMPYVGELTLAGLIERSEGHTPGARAALESSSALLDGPVASHTSPVVLSGDSDLVAMAAIGAKLAEAVEYLHGKCIAHGDIKPSNVVLEPGCSPRVIDFNLAAGQEPAFAIRGTPAYMAPELLEATLSGRPAAAHDGIRADLFALGVTLLELFTGRHPYRFNCDGTLARLLEASRVPLVASGLQLPESIKQVLRSCLVATPEERPTAGRVAAALREFVGRSRTRRSRRRRAVALIAGIVAIVGLSAGVAAALPGRENPVQPSGDRAPVTAEDFHQRGMLALSRGQADIARADFITAHERRGDPYDLALVAYCFGISGEHRIASDFNRRAMASGFDTPEVLNNLGASLMKQSLFDEALVHLDQALEQRSDLRAAKYNRAVACYQLALKPRGEAHLPLAVADINDVLRTGPYSAELHLEAARIYALASDTERAVGELKLSSTAGQNPAVIARDLILKRQLGNDSRFIFIAGQPPRPPAETVQMKLVCPVR